jgi:hypothetical protein
MRLMPESQIKPSRLEISPKIIDCGSAKIIQTSHVVAVSLIAARPYRRLARLLLLVGGAVAAGVGLHAAGVQSRQLPTMGLKELAIAGACAVVLLAVGLGLYWLTRSELRIALSDGDKLRLSSGNRQFMLDVLHALRDVLAAERHMPLRYTVNVASEKVEGGRIFAPPMEVGGHGPGVQPAVRIAQRPPPHEQRPPPQEQRPPPPRQNVVNGGHRQVGASEASNGVAKTTFAPQAVPPLPAEGPHDLDSLVDLVARSSVQHRDTLLQLLRVVDDHVKGGRTGRDDALAHWKSFSDYARGYLGDVQGLLPLADRVQRLLQKGERAAAS